MPGGGGRVEEGIPAEGNGGCGSVDPSVIGGNAGIAGFGPTVLVVATGGAGMGGIRIVLMSETGVSSVRL